MVGDQGAGRLRPERVEDADGDVPRRGRLNGLRVQDLGAEVRELGGLAERQARHELRIGDHARIGGEHAVHVGPDLNLLGVERRAEDGGGVIRPSPPERRRDALARGADEASRHDDPIRQQADGRGRPRVRASPRAEGRPA